MADQNLSTNRGCKWMRIVARILAVLWFGLWAFFNIASGIGEGGGSLIFHFIAALIFAVLLLIVWRWEKVGSIIMIIIGLFVAIAYPLTFGRRFPPITSIMMELTMALPPLLIGILLILYRRKSKTTPIIPPVV
jgi:hypothetical protein